MKQFPRQSLLAAAMAAAIGALAMAARPGFPSGVLPLLVLSLVPGAAGALLVDRRANVLEILLAATVLSPLVSASIAAAALFGGSTLQSAGAIAVGISTLLATVAILRASPAPSGLERKQALQLFVLALIFTSLVGILPQVAEFWRMRSDAWFHVAVVEEIRRSGLPPGDPYFAGMPLQYMWGYHVYVLTVSSTSGLDPFRVMALLNVQALVALIVGSFLFARALGATFARAFTSAAVVPLGISAIFWLFLPIRLAAAFTGEVRGMEEVARQFNLSPFTYENVQGLTRVWFNSEFYLDKFMVATAFSLALSLFAACWYGTAEYLRSQRRFPLFMVFFSMAGMLVFHSLVGLVMMAGLTGAAVVMRALRSRYDRTPLVVLLAPLGAAAAAFVACGPYLYSVMSAKDTVGLPFVFDIHRLAGVFISIALVLWLTIRRREFFWRRDVAAGYVIFAAISVSLFALLLDLPSSNAYDKPAYLMYYPLAVVGAWTLADFWGRKRGRGRVWAWGVILLLLLPINALSLAACYLMETPALVTNSERGATAWVRQNTSRDAVFIDMDSRVFLLVTGPRRYLYGRDAYALQWRYDREEMRRRRHVRDSLYGSHRLDGQALETLGSIEQETFVIDRTIAGTDPASTMSEFPEYFEPVYDEDQIRLYRVNRQACRAAGQNSM